MAHFIPYIGKLEGCILSEFKKAEFLSAIVYLDSLTVGTLGTVLQQMKAVELDWPCRMSREEWMAVLDRALAEQDLIKLQVEKIEDLENGHKAALFTDGDHAYVIFRGTGSDKEWEDNARGMVESDTFHQQLAAHFVARVCMLFKKITVAGHSKGGNKAQYAAIVLPSHCVNKAFSFDGQGFSLKFFEKYAKEIEERKQIITLASERRGFVHALGIPVAASEYYTGRRGAPTADRPHGDPLPYFHCPDAMRDADGNLEKSTHNLIPDIINRLVVHFLKTSTHVESTSMGLVCLVREDCDAEESSFAIARILMVLMELISIDKDFRRQVSEMLRVESEVVLATLDAANGTAGELSAINKRVARHLGGLLARDRTARHHFIDFARFLGGLKLSRLHRHISEGLSIVRRGIVANDRG